MRFPGHAIRAHFDGQAGRALYAAAAVVTVLTIGYDLALVVGSHRATAMRVASDAARTAVRDARSADATRWAPDELLAAERLSREALIAHRTEEVRFWPVPDSGRVVRAYAEAERSAKNAIVHARERSTAAEHDATSRIEQARAIVSSSETLGLTIDIGAERRRTLAQAKSALEEARAYQDAGETGRASSLAQRATELAGQVHDGAAEVASRYADADTVERWRRWKVETIAWSRRESRPAIVVFKEAHLLALFVRGQMVSTYEVDLGVNWIADKAYEGDRATPEGRYRVVSRAAYPGSMYHKVLLLDYPNAEDRARFSRARRGGGLPASARIGGLIEIHGGGGRRQDWTTGCVALANPDIDELFRRVGVGTPVTIVGNDDYGNIAEFAAQHQRSGPGRKP